MYIVCFFSYHVMYIVYEMCYNFIVDRGGIKGGKAK